MKDQCSENDECDPVDGFQWSCDGVPVVGESLPQWKWQHVQEALFAELYPMT